jgi:histidinol phosphatase-like PHP family hydrolase
MLGRENIEEYLSEIRDVQRATGVKILAGCEVDLINITERMAILPYEFPHVELNKLDYIFFEYAGTKQTYKLPPNPWKKGDKGEEGNTWKLFLRYRKLIKIPVFLAHPRFDISFSEPSDSVAKVIRTLGVGIELNSGERNSFDVGSGAKSGKGMVMFHYNYREDIYKIASEFGVRFIIGSDTHRRLGELKQVEEAKKFLDNIGGKLYFDI